MNPLTIDQLPELLNSLPDFDPGNPRQTIDAIPKPDTTDIIRKEQQRRAQERQQAMKEIHAFATYDIADETTRQLIDNNPAYSSRKRNWKDTPHDKDAMGRSLALGLYGPEGASDPSRYWRDQGKPLPPMETRSDGYRLMWEDYSRQVVEHQKQRNEHIRQLQVDQEATARKVHDYITGRGLSGATSADLLKYSDNPTETLATWNRAKAAYSYLRSNYDTGVDALTTSRSSAWQLLQILSTGQDADGQYQLDENALEIFIDIAAREMEDAQSPDSKFWFNAFTGFTSTMSKAADYLFSDQLRLTGTASIPGDLPPVGQDNTSVREEFAQMHAHREQIAKLSSKLTALTALGRQTRDDGKWYSAIIGAVNVAGNATGTTLPYLIPGGALTAALPAGIETAANDAYAEGRANPELEGLLSGSREVIEERLSFGAIGKLSRINRLLSRVPAAKLASKVPLLGKIESNALARYGLEVAFGTVEELGMEPIIGDTYEALVGNILEGLGVDIEHREWKPLATVYEGLTRDQINGTVLFVAGLAGAHLSQIRAHALQFSQDIQRNRMLGLTDAHAEEIARTTNAEERLARAKEYFNTDVIDDPAGAAQRAQKAGSDMIEQAEAALYRLSGAVEEILSQNGVTSVIKIYATDMYRVTIADAEAEHIEGQPVPTRTVEMNEEQLDAYVRLIVNETEVKAMRDFTSKVFANALARQKDATHHDITFLDANEIAELKADLDQTHEAGQVPHISGTGLMNLARRAATTINQLKQDGMSSVDAAAADTILPGVQNADIASLGQAINQRIDIHEGQPVDRNQAIRSFATHGFRFTNPTGSVIAYAKGDISALHMWEEIVESNLHTKLNHPDPAARQRNIERLGNQLRAAQQEILRHAPATRQFIKPDGDLAAIDIIEAFSTLAQSDALVGFESWNTPEWVKDIMRFVVSMLTQAQDLLRLGDAWNIVLTHEQSEAFREQNGELLDLLLQAGADISSAFTQARIEAQDREAVRQAQDRKIDETAETAVDTVDIDAIQSTGNVSFSILPEEDLAWKQNLQDYFDGKLTDTEKPIKVSSSPYILKKLGFANRDIVVSHRAIEKMYKYGEGYKDSAKHNLDYEDIENLAAAMHDPILVIESQNAGDSIVLLTDIRVAGSNVIAAIHLDKNTLTGVYHVLASAYEKRGANMIMDQINNGKLRYIDKKRALVWARSVRLQLPNVASQKGKTTILTKEDLVKDSESGFTSSLLRPQDLARETLQAHTHEARVESLIKGIDSAMERWNLVTRHGRADSAAAVYGQVSSIMAEIQRILPEGYRFATHTYLNLFADYAAMIESGRIDLTEPIPNAIRENMLKSIERESEGDPEIVQAIAAQRADRLMSKLLERVKGQLEKYLKDRIVNATMKRVKALMPKKKSGKYAKGKLSAQHNRQLKEFVRMLEVKPKYAEAEKARLQQAVEDAQNNQDTAAQSEAEAALADWLIFGNVADMNLDQARNAMTKLLDFAITGKASWTEQQNLQTWKNEHRARNVAKNIGSRKPVNDQTQRDARQRGKTSRRNWAANFIGSLQSFSQMLEGMKAIPGVGHTMERYIQWIANANIELNRRHQQRLADLQQMVMEATGLKTAKEVEKWILDSKKTEDTGISTAPWVNVSTELDFDDALEWQRLFAAKDKTALKAKQDDIKKRAKEQEIEPERFGLLQESDSNALNEAIAKRRTAKSIKVKRKVRDTSSAVTNLHLSKAEAMYMILLYEQERYRHNFDEAGYDAETIDKLYDFIGTDGLAVAYGLRDLINQQGLELATVFERMTGVPFPKESNYFRAVFRNNSTKDDAKNIVLGDTQFATGSKYGMVMLRRNHNLRLDLSNDALTVYMAAAAENDNYICTKEFVQEWRSMLAHRSFADALQVWLGDHGLSRLKGWLDIIDGAGSADAMAYLAQGKIVSKLQGGKALGLLSWNALTIIKQISALLHPFCSGRVDLGELLVGMAKTTAGQGHFKFREALKRDVFSTRSRKHEVLEEIMTYSADQNFATMKKFAMSGMNWIEKVDVLSNAISHIAMANAIYDSIEQENQRTRKEGRDADILTKEQMEDAAWREVHASMELSAQPLRRTQKSYLSAKGNPLVQILCFMGSEAINKFGNLVTFAQQGRWWKAAGVFASMSFLEQAVIAIWNMLINPPDEDEWKDFFKDNALQAPLAMLGSIPVVGAALDVAVNQLPGGNSYVGTYASSIVDYNQLARSTKRFLKAIDETDEKHDWKDGTQAVIAFLKGGSPIAGLFADSTLKPASTFSGLILSAAAASNIGRTALKKFEEEVKK